MSHRKEQLESSLQRIIGQLITEGFADPRISGLISVTGVRVSPDSRHATVGISVLPEEKQTLSVYGLRSASGHIQKEVRARLRIRAVPHLDFQVDPSIKKQAEILGAISRSRVEGEQGDAAKEQADTGAPESQEDQPS